MADLRYFIDVLITVSSRSLGWFQLNKCAPATLNRCLSKRENRFYPLACFCGSVCFACHYPACDPVPTGLIHSCNVSYRHLTVTGRSLPFSAIMGVCARVHVCVLNSGCCGGGQHRVMVPDCNTAPGANKGPFSCINGRPLHYRALTGTEHSRHSEARLGGSTVFRPSGNLLV